MNKKQHTFKGGYKFRRFENSPSNILVEGPIPERVVIPLKQGFGLGVVPLVEKQDKVVAGQIIGRDDNNISSPVHASVTGVVEDIKLLNYLGNKIQVISIRSDRTTGKDYERIKGYSSDWSKLKAEDIERLLYLSGVTSLDKDGIPTRFKSSIITPSEVENIIVHAVDSDIYNISSGVLLGENKVLNLVDGLRILNKLMPKAKIYLVLNETDTQFNKKLISAVSVHDFINIVLVEAKYPQELEEMLVTTVLGKKFPYGYSAASIGVIVLNIRTILSVYEAVTEGRPLIERIVALCGPGFKKTPYLKVKVGTLLTDALRPYLDSQINSRIVLNNVLIGEEFTDLSLPIERTFSKIIALNDNRTREFLSFTRLGLRRDSYTRSFLSSVFPFFDKIADTNVHGEERPCISCNYCEEVCPVQIIPHLLAKYAKNNIIDEDLIKFKVFDCIECGLCNYVCPSKISLLKLIKEGQRKLALEGILRADSILPHFRLKGLKGYNSIREAKTDK